MRKPPHYIAVEGPMRVGKTRLARALAERVHGRTILDAPSNPYLAGFLMGRPGAAFRTQMHFLLSRYRQCAGVDFESSHFPVVADFLLERDKLYAYLNLDDEEIRLYDSYYGVFKRQLPDPDFTVYLKASPELLRMRLSSGPESKVSDRYLETVVRAFDHFFGHFKASELLVVDAAESDLLNRPGDLQSLVEEVSRPVVGSQGVLPL